MASCFCLLLVSMMTQAAGLSTDAIQTKALLKAAAGDFGIECEYEVTTFVDPKYTETIPKQADGSIAIDLGRLLYHSDNRYRLEIVHKNLNRDTEDAIWKSRDDSKLVTYMKNRDRRDGQATIESAKNSLGLPSPTYLDIFRLAQVIEELQSPYAESSWNGSETVLGCECRILKIRHYKNQPSDRGSSSVYWIDVSKGGLVLQHEYYLGAKLARRMTVSRFHQFLQAGLSIWLPLDAIEFGYLGADKNEVSRQTLFLEVPTGRMVYHMMETSVRLFENLDTSKFALKLPNGTSVQDLITKKTYEIGQDRRARAKSDAETRQRLNEYLDQANTQAKELHAPSLDRDGGLTTTNVISWILIGLGLLGLGAIFLFRVKKR